MTNIYMAIYIITLFLCISTYFLYPFILYFLKEIINIKVQKKQITPFLSIIIPAYNEAKDIKLKLENTIALAYPSNKIEILIGSDGSTDNTSEIVHNFSHRSIRFFDFKENRGKTAVQNDLVKESKGEILIFTDAASFLPQDALRMIVRNFADERVGCVAGRMRFVGTDKNLTTQSQGLYWRYEIKIREMESQLGSLIGVDGPLYALRRECYIPLRRNIISDLITPLLVLEQGKKVVLEPGALVEEMVTQKSGQEFTTRRRITLRGLVGIFSHPELINPLKHPLLALQILFHKVIRWFVGVLILLNGLSCLVLLLYDLVFFKIAFSLYLLFALTACLGYIGERFGKKIRIFSVPYYFFLVNMAATFGVVDFLRKKQAISWETVRN